MLIGRIKRPIWSTKKSEKLEGIRLLEAEIIPWGDWDLGGSDRYIIVADNIGAGIGEYVFLTFGSAVRDVVFSEESPFKMVTTAIVDKVYLENKMIEKKSSFILSKSGGK